MNQLANSPRIRLQKHSPAYWRVTFDHPPLNIFGPRTIPQLEAVIQSLEQDSEVKGVVFDSAVEGFYLTHYDFLAPLRAEDRRAGKVWVSTCRSGWSPQH